MARAWSIHSRWQGSVPSRQGQEDMVNPFKMARVRANQARSGRHGQSIPSNPNGTTLMTLATHFDQLTDLTDSA